MEPIALSDTNAELFDSSKPFQGVVVCCTNIPADQRTEIASRAVDLGGHHKYDLTPDVTHLIVGAYDTPKYRHVAKERPDVKPMAAGWVDAVRALWMEDKEIDFPSLESEWTLKTFETHDAVAGSFVAEEKVRGRLVCCLTGFQDSDQRQHIEDMVKTNGGDYTGDLSRKVTHLIVAQPEGKKYKAAKEWDIWTVSLEWLQHSIERGMILDEKLYDPTISKEERGKGAWTRRDVPRASLGKRPRNETEGTTVKGPRKLRKTASLRISKQGSNIWGDILDKQQPSAHTARPGMERAVTMPVNPAPKAEPPAFVETLDRLLPPQPGAAPCEGDGGVFSGSRFFVYGFPPSKSQIVCKHLSSHGGQLSSSLVDAASLSHAESPNQRFLVVPHDSQPDTHPILPDGVHIVTEFYIERCLHSKQLLHPNDHVLGRPFPQFPIEGFQKMTICTAGFRDVQLNQVHKTVDLLGAEYSERLNARSSLLVCPSIEEVRKPKLDFALFSKVPVVNADWLWQCISSGFLIPWDKFLFPELKQRLSIDVDPDLEKERDKLRRSRSEPAMKKSKSNFRAPPVEVGVDRTAFEDKACVSEVSTVQRPTTNESHYETAPTHHADSHDRGQVSAPLSEISTSNLYKSPSPPKTDQPPRETLRRFPTEGTVADSEGGDESDATIARPEKGPSAEELEATRIRKREEASAAAREAISKRFKSLLDTKNDTVAQEGSEPLNLAQATRPQRRKREVLGRAVSNVSTASSASAESSGQTNASRVYSMDSIKSAPSALGLLDSINVEDAQPAATQIDYDNPDARKHRAAVLDRMHGKKEGTSAKNSQEKVTLESLKRAQAMAPGGVASGTRKSRRIILGR